MITETIKNRIKNIFTMNGNRGFTMAETIAAMALLGVVLLMGMKGFEFAAVQYKIGLDSERTIIEGENSIANGTITPVEGTVSFQLEGYGATTYEVKGEYAYPAIDEDGKGIYAFEPPAKYTE